MISGVAKSFASVTVIRVLSRVLEFVLRIYLIREVLSEEIMAQLVALDLILTSSLHILKACLKPSYQQVQIKQHKQNIISAMNLMTVGIGTTIFSSIIFCFLQWKRNIQLPYMSHAIVLYGVGAVLEALKQKYSVSMVLEYQYKKMAIIELLSYLPKTLVFFVSAKLGLFQQYGIMMFGVGQIVFIGISFIFCWFQSPTKPILFQKMQTDNQAYLDPKTKKVVKELSFISFLKLLLQQFQKIVLVINNEIKDSSVYSLVGNLGSIVVRFVFAPLQEISYNYYSRGSESESLQTFLTIIKGLGFFAFLCIGFGFRYAENVLYLMFGDKWMGEQYIIAFKAYLILLSIMGLNGTMQAFVLARADPIKTIPKFKYFTIFSTMCYISSSFFLLYLGWGAAGLFIGNTIGMAIRIVISWNVQTKRHISLGNFIIQIMPKPLFFIILTTSIWGSLYIKQIYLLTHAYDFALGILLFGVTSLAVLFQYRHLIKQMLGKIKKS